MFSSVTVIVNLENLHCLKCPQDIYRNFHVWLWETLYFGAFGILELWSQLWYCSVTISACTYILYLYNLVVWLLNICRHASRKPQTAVLIHLWLMRIKLLQQKILSNFITITTADFSSLTLLHLQLLGLTSFSIKCTYNMQNAVYFQHMYSTSKPICIRRQLTVYFSINPKN